MGLDITGYHSKKTYRWGYSGLHQIRALAVWVAGKRDSWEEAFNFLMFENENDELWKRSYYGWLEREGLLQFRQLLHFSDAEGMMVKSWVLRGIDCSRSMNLGDLDQLYDELEAIREAITTNPTKYPVPVGRMHLFWMLYNLVKDESENGIAIKFS